MTSPFAVLAEPNRLRILERLGTEELAVGELVGALRLSQPAVSKHLRVLREAGLVRVRVDGPRRLYRIRPEPFQAIDTWLLPYRAMWASSLDNLEHHLDAVTSERAPSNRPRHPPRRRHR